MDCDNLEKYLKQIDGEKYSCVSLHSDRPPKERKKNFNIFNAENVKFLICTDVAARGIDITGLPFGKMRFLLCRIEKLNCVLFQVINYTLPDDKLNYVHRIGRVGRTDHMGLAISLVSTVKEKVFSFRQCGVFFKLNLSVNRSGTIRVRLEVKNAKTGI